ncbi:Uu.00g079050.m01.CDS01 [Anthostomella pinea]|uniref:Uu.00g079050.m01.CDS01 n=1 Tax=Anthostomella pinea TaxID=933095 RepID=A0AAI8YGS8_9PEZI|nr:Uu.00g079050.m01.CDS01 [Anthostomella pinea]
MEDDASSQFKAPLRPGADVLAVKPDSPSSSSSADSLGNMVRYLTLDDGGYTRTRGGTGGPRPGRPVPGRPPTGGPRKNNWDYEIAGSVLPEASEPTESIDTGSKQSIRDPGAAVNGEHANVNPGKLGPPPGPVPHPPPYAPPRPAAGRFGRWKRTSRSCKPSFTVSVFVICKGRRPVARTCKITRMVRPWETVLPGGDAERFNQGVVL